MEIQEMTCSLMSDRTLKRELSRSEFVIDKNLRLRVLRRATESETIVL
jgi:hypothetical protein